MARYYGSVQGGRTEVHRLGHSTTGIRTLCATWGSGIEVTMDPDKDDPNEDRVEIRLVSHGYASTRPWVLYSGRLSDLRDRTPAAFEQLKLAAFNAENCQ